MPNFSNGWLTTTTEAISNSATSVTVTSVTGAPAVPFTATIAAEGSNTAETVLVTAIASLTLTIVRAVELNDGNGASAHGSGANIGAVATAGTFYEPVGAAGLIAAYNTLR